MVSHSKASVCKRAQYAYLSLTQATMIICVFTNRSFCVTACFHIANYFLAKGNRMKALASIAFLIAPRILMAAEEKRRKLTAHTA